MSRPGEIRLRLGGRTLAPIAVSDERVARRVVSALERPFVADAVVGDTLSLHRGDRVLLSVSCRSDGVWRLRSDRIAG